MSTRTLSTFVFWGKKNLRVPNQDIYAGIITFYRG